MLWVVSEQESGVKLIAFLKNKLGSRFSSRLLKRSLESNLCLVNNKIERFGTAFLGRGDRVDFRVDEIENPDESPVTKKKPSVLFEDDDFLLINKPAGVSSDSPELLQMIKGTMPFLELMHRLDRDTTGALIFAKSSEAAKAMLALFKNRKIEKHYLAIVDGTPKKNSGVIDNFLGKLHVYEGQTLWGKVKQEAGKHALTSWNVVNRGQNCALIACMPLTGRTHQIRIHLSDLRHPILGDKQYGKNFRLNCFPKRCMLHAASIVFIHPFSHKQIKVESPLPNDFKQLLKELKLQ